jgi:hypothetical protein
MSWGHRRHNTAKPAWKMITSGKNRRLTKSVTGVNYYVCVYRTVCCMLRVPGGERIVDIVPGWTELEHRLRRGIGQATNAHNNPHVKCTTVYCAYTGNNVVTSEMYGVLLSWLWVSALPHSLIVQVHSKLLVTVLEILLQTATGAQSSCNRDPTHRSRDKHLARHLINKKK